MPGVWTSWAGSESILASHFWWPRVVGPPTSHAKVTGKPDGAAQLFLHLWSSQRAHMVLISLLPMKTPQLWVGHRQHGTADPSADHPGGPLPGPLWLAFAISGSYEWTIPLLTGACGRAFVLGQAGGRCWGQLETLTVHARVIYPSLFLVFMNHSLVIGNNSQNTDDAFDFEWGWQCSNFVFRV